MSFPGVYSWKMIQEADDIVDAGVGAGVTAITFSTASHFEVENQV